MPRVTTQYILSGSRFLRLASRALKLDQRYGTNLQNIENYARRMYHADDGYHINQRDQSGAEALIVAYLCRYGNFRELFLHNIKPHVFVGLHLFKEIWKKKVQTIGLDIHPDIDELCNTPISNLRANPHFKPVEKLIKKSDEWTASERYYYIAKQVCHSSNYGIRPAAFCLNTLEKSLGKIVLSKRDAEYFLEMYHSLFPEIREWHRDVEMQVTTTGILYNLFGEPITFTDDLQTEKAMKEAYSAVPQSTVAEITNNAVVLMQNYIETVGVRWDILGNTHDSFFVQSPIAECEQCQAVMKQFIEPELQNFKGEKFNMKSEGGTGYNWGKYHETKNPEGLKEAA